MRDDGWDGPSALERAAAPTVERPEKVQRRQGPAATVQSARSVVLLLLAPHRGGRFGAAARLFVHSRGDRENVGAVSCRGRG